MMHGLDSSPSGDRVGLLQNLKSRSRKWPNDVGNNFIFHAMSRMVANHNRSRGGE